MGQLEIIVAPVGFIVTIVVFVVTTVGAVLYEVKVAALTVKLEPKAAESTVQRNHRELLIRLAFHHHGDGRYPVAPATDPDPMESSSDDG